MQQSRLLDFGPIGQIGIASKESEARKSESATRLRTDQFQDCLERKACPANFARSAEIVRPSVFSCPLLIGYGMNSKRAKSLCASCKEVTRNESIHDQKNKQQNEIELGMRRNVTRSKGQDNRQA
jgi:hypothetical protein